MKKLILMRHARAERKGADGTDQGRVLHRKGINAIAKIGAYLQNEGHRPGLIVHSSAKRTTQTAWELCDILTPQPMTMGLDALYLADPKAILETIQGTESTIDTLMLVGHSPGIADTALAMVDMKTSDVSADALRAFPPAAIAILHIDVTNWGVARVGFLAHYVFAEDLP